MASVTTCLDSERTRCRQSRGTEDHRGHTGREGMRWDEKIAIPIYADFSYKNHKEAKFLLSVMLRQRGHLIFC